VAGRGEPEGGVEEERMAVAGAGREPAAAGGPLRVLQAALAPRPVRDARPDARPARPRPRRPEGGGEPRLHGRRAGPDGRRGVGGEEEPNPPAPFPGREG